MDLLSIDNLTDDEIGRILDRAQILFEDDRSATKPVQTLDRKIVFNLFYENSTRTRTSDRRSDRSNSSLEAVHHAPRSKPPGRSNRSPAGSARSTRDSR